MEFLPSTLYLIYIYLLDSCNKQPIFYFLFVRKIFDCCKVSEKFEWKKIELWIVIIFFLFQ